MLSIRTGSFITYFLFIPMMIIYHTVESIKQIFYLLPLLVTAIVLLDRLFSRSQKPVVLDRNMLSVFFLFVLVSCASIFHSPYPVYWFSFMRDFIIIAGPLIIFMYDIDFSKGDVVALLLTGILTYLIWIRFGLDFVFLKSLLESNFAASHEYDYGTIVGIFVIYFLYKKDYKFLGLAILYLMFVNKRAVFLGIIPAVIVYYSIVKVFRLEEKKNLLFVFLLGYYLIFYLISINLVDFTEIFLAMMDRKDIRLDDFLTGRMIMYNALAPELYNRGWLNFFFGNGLGQADYYLWQTIKHPVYEFYTKPINPHNDFLKLHFDIGLIGILAYFLVMYYMYCVSNVGIMIFLFVIPLFLIENTLIYYINLIMCCVVVRADVKTAPLLSFKYEV